MPVVTIPFDSVDRQGDGAAANAVAAFILSPAKRSEENIQRLDLGKFRDEAVTVSGAHGSTVSLLPEANALRIEVGERQAMSAELADLALALESMRVMYRIDFEGGLASRAFAPSDLGDRVTIKDAFQSVTMDANVANPALSQDSAHAVGSWSEAVKDYADFIDQGRPPALGPASMAWRLTQSAPAPVATVDSHLAAAPPADTPAAADIAPPMANAFDDITGARANGLPAEQAREIELNSTGTYAASGTEAEWRQVLTRAAAADPQAFHGVDVGQMVDAIMANGGAASGQMSVAQAKAVGQSAMTLNFANGNAIGGPDRAPAFGGRTARDRLAGPGN